MLDVAHQATVRQRLAGAAGLGVVVHAFLLAGLGVVVVHRGGGGDLEESIEVVPVDEERVRATALEIERQAAPVFVGPVAPIVEERPASRIAHDDVEVVREVRVRAPDGKLARVPLHSHARPVANDETGGAQVAGRAAVGDGPEAQGGPPVMSAGEGERAPVARRELTAPPPPPGAGAAAAKSEATASEPPLAAAPAVIAPIADTAAVRARRSDLAVFMHAVEVSVARNWFPSDVYERVDPTGTISGTERRTAMRVRVRADGRVERIDVETGSGVPAMDEEAKAAFTRAQPFARPPASVLDAGGGVTFPFAMSLDLELARWKASVRREVRRAWQPRSHLYVDRDRTTVVRVVLRPDGAVTEAALESSSGNVFLDGSTRSVVRPGMLLARPPASLPVVGGVIAVHLEFIHHFRGEHEVQVTTED